MKRSIIFALITMFIVGFSYLTSVDPSLITLGVVLAITMDIYWKVDEINDRQIEIERERES